MTDSKEELRPCPFHGLQSEVKSWPGDEEMKILPQFGCEMVGCFAAHGKTIKEAAANWNSAYCWKLLDESREREKKYREALKKNGRHVESCLAWCGESKGQRWSRLDESKCNCGLTEALKDTGVK